MEPVDTADAAPDGPTLAGRLVAAACAPASPIDGLSAACAVVRDAWRAERVSVWSFDPGARTASPLASSQPHEELMASARRWARTPLDAAPALADVAAGRTVMLGPQELAERLPAGFAFDFGMRSAWVAPLRAADLTAMLCVEPAAARPSPAASSVVAPVLTLAVARVTALRDADLRRQQLDVLVALAASIAEQTSVRRTLTDACERLARTVRARRASVWLVKDDRLLPITAGYADGRRDRSGFEEFRAADPPTIVREVLRTGVPAMRLGDELEPWWREVFDLGSVFAVPIGVPPDVVGVLVVDSEKPRGFGEPHMRLAVAVAANLATLLRLGQLSELREQELAALKAANEAKNVFLSAVSHELRTPLTVIRGMAATLRDRADTIAPELAGHMLERLHHNALKLERLLLDLLDVDRLARNTLEPRRRPTDVARLVGNLVDSLDHPDHPIAAHLTSVVVDVDPAQVERIVENLVSNACKYSPAGSPVDVRVEPSADGVLIAVEDRGPGVPPAHRDRVFEPFHRLDEDHPSPGTGVGLTLVAEFAALHGGRAWVEERPGGGARFVVALPAGGDRATDAAAETSA